jgi:hypothetical protein
MPLLVISSAPTIGSISTRLPAHPLWIGASWRRGWTRFRSLPLSAVADDWLLQCALSTSGSSLRHRASPHPEGDRQRAR